MPARRLVVALTVLLVGVLGLGVVTAINRSGETPSDTTAQPTPTPPVFTTEPPLPTTEPTETPLATTPPPTVAPTVAPTATPTGGGNGGKPRMPNTGAPFALAIVATAAVAAGATTVRLSRAG